MNYDKPYEKEQSVLKPRRNIHKLVPEYKTIDEAPTFYKMYEQNFIQGMKDSLVEGGNALVEVFYWRYDVHNRLVLVAKRMLTYSEIKLEVFLKYHDGEIKEMR